ncbi:ATP-binding protein [Candidatus Poriferisodalis sp.]|uniref:ATP-binding protein n=1 Tax=Candidatus Poriferisodalis sp. TaxID=3101277 RepID=UPI003B51B926
MAPSAADAVSYVPRVIDADIERFLRLVPTVVIDGPRGCGKTTSARQFCASEVALDEMPNAHRAAQIDPRSILDGDTPRLIDEWQLAPGIWNAVRRASDDRRSTGQFILTGSALPADDITRHSGAGRIGRVRMRPMSLYEQGVSDSSVSLGALMGGAAPNAVAPAHPLDDVAEWICRGGFPQTLGLSTQDAQQFLRLYLEEINRADIERVDGISRDPARVNRLMQSLARNVSTRATLRTLARDTGGAHLDPKTVTSYLSALERVFIVDDAPAWSPRLRSRTTLRAAPVRQLADPALACALLRTDPERLLGDLETLGLLFESLVVRDLRVYSGPTRAWVGHYRDETGLETDAIVEASDGTWAAFEVKLGGEEAVDRAAASLLKLAQRVDPAVRSRNRALAVMTATGGYAYQRPDGVSVIPITTLGP